MNETAQNPVQLYPRKALILTNVGLQALAIAMAILAVREWNGLSSFGKGCVVFSVVLMTVAAIDGLQKRYCIFTDKIRVRTLFYWRDTPLPARPRASVHEFRGVRVTERGTDKLLLRIPRDFGPSELIARQLNALWNE